MMTTTIMVPVLALALLVAGVSALVSIALWVRWMNAIDNVSEIADTRHATPAKYQDGKRRAPNEPLGL